MLQQLAHSGSILLADEPPFTLGDIRFEPSRLTAARAGCRHAVEPRVMMVLVVLAQADGRVVSRDELVQRCWDGRIVGENAIQRVISRIRHLAGALGGFAIETIPRVGYLLRPQPPGAPVGPPEDQPASEPKPGPAPPGTAGPGPDPPGAGPNPAPPRSASQPPAPGPLGRRALLAGLVATGAASAALYAWPRRPPAAASPADRLVAKAREIQLAALPGAEDQAIAFLVRATELDPKSSAAWGNLALAHARKLESSPDPALAATADWSRSAGTRALALDPGNLEAQLALASIQPNFRNWAANEAALRALIDRHPPSPRLEGALGWLLCDTGRWRDAIARFRNALRMEPYNPDNRLVLAWGLWGGGDMAEADRMLAGIRALWPKDQSVWQTSFDFLATTGRPGAALALVSNPANHPELPTGQDPPDYAVLAAFARAMETGDASAFNRAAPDPEQLRRQAGTISAVTYLCSLDRVDEAFAVLEGFFLGNATRPPPGPLARRKTSVLFSRKAAALRGHPRYPPLLERLGLMAYWRETGSRPDLREVPIRL